MLTAHTQCPCRRDHRYCIQNALADEIAGIAYRMPLRSELQYRRNDIADGITSICGKTIDKWQGTYGILQTDMLECLLYFESVPDP